MKIVVASGIGDFSWVWSKLCQLDCEFHVGVAQTGGPLRLVQLLDLLPKVKAHSKVPMSFAQLKQLGVPSPTTIVGLDQIWREKGVVYTEANTHIETGNRIETWIPEIPIDYHYDINIPQQYVDIALAFMVESPFVVLYTSQIATSTAWCGWLSTQWVQFMELLRKRVGDISFVLVGAAWDVDMATQIEAQVKPLHLKFHNLVNKLHLGSTLHLMNLAKYTVAFPSGIAVLSDVICSPATMFWPKALPHINMVGKFADPESISSGRFHETFFCDPKVLVDWIVGEYKLADKL